MIRRAVEVQQRPNTVDNFGAPDGVWDTLFTLGAQVEPLSEAETVSVNREIDSLVYRFIFPKGSNSILITTNHRIIFGGQEFDILTVNGVSLRGREVIVTAEAIS